MAKNSTNKLTKITKLAGIFAPLLEIPEPPEQLYIEGALPTPETILLAVVGSRRYSQYGKEVCEKLIEGLRGQPISIISGLAVGMDTIAHKTALDAGLHTISFPGSGLDRSVLHPHSNRKLADEIVESGGALISEYDPTYPAGVHTFPRRNRLMAGLAKAVLVIEAGEKSGTRITARLATEYNRDVLAVPGSIFSMQSQGTNSLIKLGATPITSSNDILTALGLQVDEYGQRELNLDSLTEIERKIVELLMIEPLERDAILRGLDVGVSQANTALATLEIKGVITESLGEVHLN
ncbi:MAG TPA: DNA-processing protein DprA [Candidatus Paceibacterota bacterium]